MSEATKGRSLKFSSTQKEAMVDFMELNPKLRRGKYSKEFTQKMGEKLWHELTNFLDALPGCQKDINQWRKTWQDLKATVKAKSSAVTQNVNQTGGGRATGVPLSALEERVKSFIGNTNIDGNPEIPESAVNMDWESSTSYMAYVKRINDQIIQNDLDDQDDVECSRSNHEPPITTITLPAITTNGGSSLAIRSTASDVNSPSPNRLQQGTSPPASTTTSPAAIRSTASVVNSPSPNHVEQGASPDRRARVHPTINYLQNIVSREQTSPISQTASRRTYTLASSTGTVNKVPRLSTNTSRRRSPISPYSRERPSSSNQYISPNSNVNALFESSQRPNSVSTKKSKPRQIATQRFDKTIDATEKLVQELKKKAEMKERYYKYKLELMDANVRAQEGIAAALGDIASAMKQN